MSEPDKPEPDNTSIGGVFQISPETTPRGVDLSSHSNDDSSPQAKRNRSHKNRIPPDFRTWESVNKQLGNNGDTFKFKVLSYNVLAQYLLEWHPYLYRECATHCLKWKYRSALLLEEITHLSPDILCLQEVQCSHIPTFYKKLEEMGYVGVFKQKTGHRQDGCAIYFKNSMFKMRDYISVEFYQPDLPMLNRDNIGIIIKLIPNNMPESAFIVATTHLLFNPKRTDVRLAQLQLFLAEIDRFSYSSKTGRGHAPIILTGDLNSTPTSAVIDLLTSGNVRASPYRDGSDWKKIGVTDNCQHIAVHLSRMNGDIRRIDPSKLMIQHTGYTNNSCMRPPSLENPISGSEELFNSGYLGHSLNLKSVYGHMKTDGQSEASTYQNEWVTVDYIYFSHQNRLNLLERLYLPTSKECEVLDSLPNDVYGSDHLALGAIFELKSIKSML